MQEPKRDFIDETLEFWQQRASTPLTREDARQIIENVAGFFNVIQEWEKEEESK